MVINCLIQSSSHKFLILIIQNYKVFTLPAAGEASVLSASPYPCSHLQKSVWRLPQVLLRLMLVLYRSWMVGIRHSKQTATWNIGASTVRLSTIRVMISFQGHCPDGPRNVTSTWTHNTTVWKSSQIRQSVLGISVLSYHFKELLWHNPVPFNCICGRHTLAV